MREIEIEIEKLVKGVVIILAISLISYVGVWLRLATLKSPTVLDYDPWWFYRYAAMILDNNLKPPKWDEQSFAPPGRPVTKYLGWPYTIILIYKIGKIFYPKFTLMEAAKISPLVMVALIPIPAFLIGSLLTNEIGGLVTAFFSVTVPSFIGVSMAGYCDTDAPIFFYLLLSAYTFLLLIKKKSNLPFYLVLSVLANLLFVWTWGGGWLIPGIFTFFFLLFPLFRIFEKFLRKGVELKNLIYDYLKAFSATLERCKWLYISIAITNLLSFALFRSTEFHSLLGGVAFTGLGLVVRFVFIFSFVAIVSLVCFTVLKKKKKKREDLIVFSLSIPLFPLIFLASLIVPTKPLLVNISVAELQPLKLIQFPTLIARNGLLLTLSPIFLVFFFLWKVYKKIEIKEEEILFFLWSFSMLFLITRGLRFSLQFSAAAAVTIGYLVGSFKSNPKFIFLLLLVSLILLKVFYFPSNLYYNLAFIFFISLLILAFIRDKFIKPLIFSILTIHCLFAFSEAARFGLQGGMMISKNWYDMLDWFVSNADKDALLVTWWDPGHILAGYTYYKGKPLRVHADGAHCGPNACIPYDHNIRIQDMGRIFSTNSEDEAINILRKYANLSEEDCKRAKEKYPQMPLKACRPASEMYIIASNDLIGKYYWMSYFGTGTGRNFIQLPLTSVTQEKLVYGNGLIFVVNKTGKFVPFLNLPSQGLYNVVITEIEYYQNGRRIRQEYKKAENKIDGLLWIDPSYRTAIFMDPVIKESLFAKMFFWYGEGLKHFKLVYYNPEIRVFKVEF